MRRSMLPLLLAALACTMVIPTTSHAQAATKEPAPKQAGHAVSAPALAPELVSVKASLEKYQDPIVALRDGYLSTVGCIDFPKGAKDGPITYPPGAMGVHFLNMGNVGPKLDPAKPQVLIYEPVNGKLKLAAAEWFVPEQLAGGKAPVLFGQTFAGPMDGHYPVMPKSLRHYDLHVWLWKPNPKGVFTSTNAALKCRAGDPYTYSEGADAHHHM
jgi:hypothetical protein